MNRPSVRQRRQSQIAARASALFSGQSLPAPSGVEIDMFFADDSRQRTPSRPGMNALVAIGGIGVPADHVRFVTTAIDELCHSAGFPPRNEFKWSPGPELWMRKGLVAEARRDFYLALIGLLRGAEATAIVVVADTKYQPATKAKDPESDVTTMFLERVNNVSGKKSTSAIVVADRPSGSRADEDAFLARCLDMLESGTTYVQPKNLLHTVLSAPSHLSRLLQAADVITGATLAFVAGEDRFSPPIFEAILPLLARESSNRCGGIGLKIHPDYRYCNLYHWLLGDTFLEKLQLGLPFPLSGRPYSKSPLAP